MDEIRWALWDGMQHLFPSNAEVSQREAGNLVITWRVRNILDRPNAMARNISVRFAPEVIRAMAAAGTTGRKHIAAKAADIVDKHLYGYNLSNDQTESWVISVGHEALDR